VLKLEHKFPKILVTGGAGFIGSHIVDKLLSYDFEVTIIDNLSSGNLENINNYKEKPNLKFIKGDIRDLNLVKEITKDKDAVFHEAALASVTLSVENPILTNDINVSGTLNLLKASVDHRVKRFIFASSAAIYGETPSPQKREDLTSTPTNPYGVSKLAAENYVKVFHKVYGLETVSLRYFNVYGPRQRFDIQSAYGGVITIFTNRLLRNLPPIIYGDGEQTRDFVYVEDVVQANMLALKSKNCVGEVFNVGTGTTVSVNQVANTLKEILKRNDLRNIYADPQPADVRHGYADISKAKKILGYDPKFSFNEGISKLVNWYSKKSIPDEDSAR
jgi:nucleoside-diphosphate-sugar epimerase